MSTIIKVAVIPCNDDEPITIRELDRSDIEAMQELVHGDFDCINIQNPEASIWCNDSGKIDGLDTNRRVTCLLWLHRSAFRGRDVVVGDCFISGSADFDGELTSIPDQLLDLFTKPATYRIEVQTLGSEA